MKIVIQDDNGNDLQEFVLPEGTRIVSPEQADRMGKTLATSLNSLVIEMENFEKKLEKHCDCFWIKQSPEERKLMRHHSSECASWDM